MSNYTYKQILSKAKTCQTNVKKEYKTGISSNWCYYFAKSILNPKKDIKKVTISDAPSPKGTSISRQIKQIDYKQICKDLIKFVENPKYKRLPNYVGFGKFQLTPHLLTEFLSRILVWYDKNGRLPNEANINSKVFTKPLETTNSVYKYFIDKLNKGKQVKTIDESLTLVDGSGYSGYYDDKLTNKQAIDAMAENKKDDSKDPNCTDACHVFMNIGLQLVAWKIYKKIECLHVDCSSGGHVKLRITKNDGSTFIRDPACVISHNGKPITCVWCTNSPKAVNPSWFMSNLNR